MLENLIATLKSNPRTIVFTEGPDPRILEAASRLKKDGILTSILIGKVDEVKAAAAQGDLISKESRLLTLQLIRKWMLWLRKWLSCAREK